MPLYEYKCVDCGENDHRIAGLDDHTALCAKCGGLMLRLFTMRMFLRPTAWKLSQSSRVNYETS